MLTGGECLRLPPRADVRIGDEEECALRDRLLAFHLKTLQPEILGRVAPAVRRHTAAAGSVAQAPLRRWQTSLQRYRLPL